MRGENASSAAAIDAVDDPKLAGTMQAALNRLVHDPEKTRALIAGNFAPACSSATRAMPAAVERPSWPQEPRPRLCMECIANLSGCILADSAAPAYAGCGVRAQDGGPRRELWTGIGMLS